MHPSPYELDVTNPNNIAQITTGPWEGWWRITGSAARRRRNKNHSHLSLNWERDTCKHLTLGMKKQGAFGAGSADESPLRRQVMWQLMWKGSVLHHRWCGGNDLWREMLMDWMVLIIQRATSRKPRGHVATGAFLQFEHCLSAILSFKIFNVKKQLLLNSMNAAFWRHVFEIQKSDDTWWMYG